MKKLTCLLILFLIVASTYVSSGQTKTYTTTGWEMIFSLANIDDNGVSEGSTLRWAPVVNVQTMLNVDMSSNFGIFTGLGLRNVGYIYDSYTDPADESMYKKKFRSYNLAVPLGIKLGNMEKMFLYGGYEVELPVLYKEKTFEGGDKIDKITGWFSSRQELFQHGFLVGIQFPYGTNIKFKYYLSEFHNRNYINSQGVKPYEGLKSNIFYFSLNMFMFKNLDFYVYD